MKHFLSTVLFISVLTVPVMAEDKLAGTYSVDEDKNLSFSIEGAAAKALYDGMTGKAVAQECTGGMDKTDKSGLTCSKEGDGYTCSFGYNFKKHVFSGASSGEDC